MDFVFNLRLLLYLCKVQKADVSVVALHSDVRESHQDFSIEILIRPR